MTTIECPATRAEIFKRIMVAAEVLGIPQDGDAAMVSRYVGNATDSRPDPEPPRMRTNEPRQRFRRSLRHASGSTEPDRVHVSTIIPSDVARY